jgi:hypothetical protein
MTYLLQCKLTENVTMATSANRESEVPGLHWKQFQIELRVRIVKLTRTLLSIAVAAFSIRFAQSLFCSSGEDGV